MLDTGIHKYIALCDKSMAFIETDHADLRMQEHLIVSGLSGLFNDSGQQTGADTGTAKSF